ncbi:MAG: hypothetical protein BGO34_14395 [Bacteroidia bacterium 44-10]|nr:MAG: hypothetical protein BGO34_14395 [Bacteroidia bacterium 44-10]
MQHFHPFYKTILITVVVLMVCHIGPVKSQNNHFRVNGVLLDATDSSPVELAVVSIPNLGIWSITDESGHFSFESVPQGTHIFNFRLLGYQETNITRMVTSDIHNWQQKLQPATLALEEVTVTATQGKLGSSSKIESVAIEHIQAKSLTDVFQLLPGHVTENPTLASPGQVKIREISENPNSALGTLVMVDGAPMSNDANMQTFNTTRSGNVSVATNTVGRGVDLREISADNIEEVEVIRGIPSSEYGNLTSGVVLVKTKAGVQPWMVKAKMDPNTKMGNVSKGFRLPDRSGTLNLGVDYAQAYNDIRYKYRGYKRLTGTAIYANTFMEKSTPLDLNARISYFQTIDDNKSDAQLNKEEAIRSSNKGIRAGINGKWMLRKSWITNLEYSLSGDYAWSENYVKQLQSLPTGIVPYPTSYVDGIFEENYLPAIFYTEYTTEGKPYNFFAKVKANLNRQFGETVNSLIAGIDISVSGNNGKGLQYDLSAPPMSNLDSSIRPRADKDLPVLRNYSLFIEDKLIQPIGTTILTAQAGIRFSHTQPGSYTSTEPRLNTAWEVLNKDNNKLFDRLSINMGYGVSAKMPTISYISPDKAYFDNLSFNYYDTNHHLAVVTTKVVDTQNPGLKPARSTKKEIGFSFDIQKVSVSVTGFHEKLKDGMLFSSVPYFAPYRKFTVTGAGKTPEFDNGEVFYYENGERLQAPSVMDTAVYTYNIPVNNQVLVKKGLEYVIQVGQIKSIRTSFVIDGAWLFQESYNVNPTYLQRSRVENGALASYVAVMPSGVRKIQQRFNTNIRMITHIPELKMIVSFAPQIIWTQRVKDRWEDENGNSVIYYFNDNGERVYNHTALQDMETARYIDPLAFFSKDGQLHEWKQEYAQDSRYAFLRSSNQYTYQYVEEVLPAALQFNLRLTKEFSRNLMLSFMANNFLKMNPSHKSNRTSQYVQRNTSFYFGAEIQYKL